MKVLVIGIGRAGLGIVVPTFLEADYHVSVTHYSSDKLETLKAGYTLKTPNESQDIEVDIQEMTSIQDEYDAIVTCVGKNNLYDVIGWYSEKKITAPLFFAENMFNSKEFNIEHTPIVIDRICSKIIDNGRLTVVTEEYKKITTLRTQITQRLEISNSVTLLDTIDEVELLRTNKLYSVNVAHKLIGIYSLDTNYVYVEEAVSDKKISNKLRMSMLEIAPFLNKSKDEMGEVIATILSRFASPIEDPLLRIYHPLNDDTAVQYLHTIISDLSNKGEPSPLLNEALEVVKDHRK